MVYDKLRISIVGGYCEFNFNFVDNSSNIVVFFWTFNVDWCIEK